MPSAALGSFRRFALVVALLALGVALLPALPATAAPPRQAGPPAGELPDKRTAASKTVRNTDGTLTTTAFAGPVHYRDGKGEWQPIDTSLVPGRHPGYRWTSAANRFEASFKETAGADFVRFAADGRAVTLTPLDMAPGRARHEGANVTYEGMSHGVDLRYGVMSSGVKETMVLAHPGVPTEYRFRLGGDTRDLRAERRSDGSWEFFTAHASDPAFTLDAPRAVDGAGPGQAAGAAASNATLDVAPDRDGFVLTTKLDPAWLLAPGRVFPVELDPTIAIQPTSEDANFSSTCTNCTPFLSERIYVGGGNNDNWRGALKFDLSSLPSGSVVTAANLGLYWDRYCITSSSWCAGNSHQVDAHRMTTAWTTSNTTSQLTFDAATLSSVTIPYDAAAAWKAWPITDTVKGWVAGTTPNHGLLLKRSTEALGTSGPTFPGRRFTGATSLQPKLEITYTSDAVDLLVPPVLHANGAELRWTKYAGPSGAPFDRYEVHRSSDPNFTPSTSTLLATIRDIASTEFRDTRAAPSKSFTYKVVANSAASNARTVALPADGQASIELQPGPASGEQTFLRYASDMTNCANYGVDEDLFIGSTPTAISRPVLAFDVRSIPTGAAVASARLSLWQQFSMTSSASIRAYRVTRDWREGTGNVVCTGDGATWYDADGGVTWNAQGGDFDGASASPALAKPAGESAGWDDFDVKALVQQWASGQSPNLGFLLKADDEALASGKQFAYFSDDFTGEATLRPKLTVAYADGSHAQGPTSSVTGPVAGAVVAGTAVPLSAQSGDDRRVDNVEFLVNGAVVGSDTTEPYAATWDSTKVLNGSHSLTVRATDDAGNVTTSPAVSVTVDNTAPPTVSLTAPASGATVAGNVTVSANASDDRRVDRVEFFFDDQRFAESTTSPYSVTWNTLDLTQPAYDGARTLTAKAYDDAGQVTTSVARTVTVANTTGTKYRAGLTTSAVPPSVNYDPAAGATQERQGVDLTILNNSSSTFSATDVKAHYRWVAPDGSLATGTGVTNSAAVSMPADLRAGRSTTVRLMVDPPVLPEGVDRSQYRLQFDLKDAAGTWFASKGNAPADNWVIVNKKLATALGLERFYHYDGAEIGGGMEHMVNVANGNSILHWRPSESPGRGLSTVVDLTYNSLEQRSESPAGNNFSLAISGLSRLGNPLDVHPNNADSIAGRSNKWIAFTDADGTPWRFEGVTAADGTTYYKEPAGVHLYLRQFSSTDATKRWALTRPDRVTFFYDSDGFPTGVEDANGNRLHVTLETTPPGDDPGGPKKRVTAITDAAGLGTTPAANRVFRIDYWTKAEVHKAQQRGKIQRITDHDGSALDFLYYEDGNLRRITQRGGVTADGVSTPDRSWTFTYTTSAGDGPAIPTADARVNPDARAPNQSSRLFSVRDPNGRETTFTYYGPTSGQLRWRLASRTDRAGATTSYSYDLVNRVATVAAPMSRTSKFAYGADGSVTTITRPDNAVSGITWSAGRRPWKVTEPTGKYREFAYNDNGYVTDQWDQLRNHTKLDYEHVAVDGNDVTGKWATGRTTPHISQLVRKTSPKGMATSSPTDDFQWSFTYDPKGNLLTVTDPVGGGVTTHTYNANGTVASTRDQNLHTTTFNTYDANGKVTKATDAKGQVTQLGHDDDGLLTFVQDARHAADTGTAPEQYRSRYYYDSFGRLARTSTPKSTLHERGTLVWTGTEYDGNDNVIASVAPHFGPEYTGSGPRTTTAYDAMDRPVLVTGADTSADPAGERVTVTWDAAGRMVRKTSPKGVATPTIADDHTEELAYDALDRVVRQTRYEVNGTTTTPRTSHYCYDAADDLRWVTAPKAGVASVNCAAVTPPSHTTRLEYDAAHKPLSTTDPEGRKQSKTYDANGNVETKTDAAGTTMTMAYDQRNLPVQLVQPFSANPVKSLTTRYEYDKAGNRTRLISPRAWDASSDKSTFNDFVTTYDYDELDQPHRIRLPKSGAEQQLYVHRAFDGNGNVVRTTLPDPADAEANVPATKRTVVEYFDPGWVRTSDEPGTPRVRFDYEADGKQSSRTPENDAGELLTGHTMTWSYYADGMLKERKDKGGQGSTYVYDANNNLVEANDSAGLIDNTESPVELVAEYDSLDRVVRSHQHKKADPATAWRFTAYTYDPNSNPLTREDDGTETRDAVTKAFTQTAAGHKHDFTYDTGDWLTQAWDHGKSAALDADDLRTTTAFTPTKWERQRTVEAGTATGGWTTRQTTNWDYFLNGKLQRLVTKNGAGTTVEEHTVGYEDAGVYVNGHRTTDTFLVKGPDANASCYSATCVARYTYDARDRLLREDNGRNTVTNYTLDTAGNVTTEAITKGGSTTTKTSTYTGDRLQTLTSAGQTFKYLYDIEGNIDCITGSAWSGSACPTSGTGGAVNSALVADYAYDYLNRMRSFRRYSSGTVQDSADYVYDALDRLVKEVESHNGGAAKTTLFSHLGLTPRIGEEQQTQSGTTTTKSYSYDAYGHRLGMSRTSNGSTTRGTYGYDVHGSVSMLLGTATDPNKAEAAYAYRPYGESDTDGSRGDTDDKNPINPFRYSGKRFDSGSGTLDMGARRYGPDSGRFLQQDRFNGALADLSLSTDPLTQNRYGMAGGNPVGFVEWDGHIFMVDGGGGAAKDPEPQSSGSSSGSGCSVVMISCGDAVDGGRSVADYGARTALSEANIRDLYNAGDRAIVKEADELLKAGKSQEEVARWAVDARNELRRSLRAQGSPINDNLQAMKRGRWDYPTYDMLRLEKGKSDAQVIESAGKTNAQANRATGKLRIAGRITIAFEVLAAGHAVISAPEVDRPKVMLKETARVGGALAGGAAGAKGGAMLGGGIGSFFGPGPGTAIGGFIGGVVGGIGGAVAGGFAGEKAAEWAIDEFYPTSDTGVEPYP